MNNMKVEYSGHGARTGGLQAHSVGDEYPYIIFVRESYGNKSYAEREANGEAMPPKQYVIMDSRTSRESSPFRTYQEAYLYVVQLKIRNMMHAPRKVSEQGEQHALAA